MKFEEYIEPDTHIIGFHAKRSILSISPGATIETISENEKSVGDEEEFNW